MAGTGKISIVMDISWVLNNINIEALSMMNPSSIAAVHAIHQNVLLHKGLTKILLIQASSTRAQNFNAVTEFSLNEAHKLSDTINVFSGKQSAMNPTPIYLRMHRRKDTNQQLYTNSKLYIQQIQRNFIPVVSLDALGMPRMLQPQ